MLTKHTLSYCYRVSHYESEKVVRPSSVYAGDSFYPNNQVHYALLVVLLCLPITLPHYHHCADIWKYGTSKMLFRYILSSVYLQLCQLSQLSSIHCVWLRVFGLPIYLMIIVRIQVLYLIIIVKSEVWLICLCFGLARETMVCTAWPSIPLG